MAVVEDETLARATVVAAAIQQARQCNSSRADILNRRLLDADAELFLAHGSVEPTTQHGRSRIAILSLLFNWPSTGGGIVHTAELARFLTTAGYEVCHFFAVYRRWQVGCVEAVLPYPAVAIEFDEAGWNRENIQCAFRQAVDEFVPDGVIITDSWNSKGLLASAVADYPYFIRLAAMECLCPLNNVRLLPGQRGRAVQCRKSQLATRDDCLHCVERNQHTSGWLHAAERELAGFTQPEFFTELKNVFANAEAILAVNPLIATLCEPYAREVQVIPSGFDARRFDNLKHRSFEDRPFRLLFAGLTGEYMKGFHVLLDACQKLWQQRQDFELHVTSDETMNDVPFVRMRGWQSQESLPSVMADGHAVIVPTIAQEALGRTAVEGMGAGRPVIASRIGGLPFVITHDVTGLLFEPEDVTGLVKCITRLMDHPNEALEMGTRGRSRFLAEHTWDTVIRDKYLPLFATLPTAAGRARQ